MSTMPWRWAGSFAAVLAACISLSSAAAETMNREVGEPPEQEASALSPPQLFNRLSPSIFIVQVRDRKGSVIAFGSGVAISEGLKPGRPNWLIKVQAPCAKANGQVVATNYHVVDKGVALAVRRGAQSWQSKITHVDPKHDLALLCCQGLKAPPLLLRDSSTVQVGERVYSLGAPAGLELTLSEGIVSGLREQDGVSVIQTTAPLSHGSSGGGLFDAQGRLVGITSFSVKNGQNLNFALPVEWVLALDQYPVGERARSKPQTEPTPRQQRSQPAEYAQGVALAGYLMRGQELMQKKLYQQAEREYRLAIALYPDDAGLHVLLGYALADQEKWSSAATEFRKAIALDPSDAKAYIELGNVLNSLRDIDGAITAYRKGLELEPDNASGRLGLAMQLHFKGDLEGTIREEAKYLALMPGDGFAHFFMSCRLADQGDIDGAIAENKKALALGPSNEDLKPGQPNWLPLAHCGLGVLLRERKQDLDGASAEFREAIRLDPASAEAHMGLGLTLAEKGNMEGAIAEYRQVLRLGPNSPGLQNSLGCLPDKTNSIDAVSPVSCVQYSLGESLERAGDVDTAISAFREAVRLDQKNWSAFVGLTQALRSKGDIDVVITAYRDRLKTHEDDGSVWLLLGQALDQKGDPEVAISTYRDMLRLQPESRLALEYLGRELEARGDLDAAIALYRGALPRHARYPREHGALGRLLVKRGSVGPLLVSKESVDAGIAELQTSVRLVLSDKDAQADGDFMLTDLNKALQLKGDFGGAVAECRKALSRFPEGYSVHMNLADALVKKGDLDAAATEYRVASRLAQRTVEPRLKLGKLLFERGQVDGAIAEYREVLSLDPGHVGAHYYLSVALLKKGDAGGASAEYRKAASGPSDQPEAHAKLGGWLLDHEDWDRAISEFREAIRLKPTEAGFHGGLAGAFLGKGDLDGCITEYRRAMELEPSSPGVAEGHWFLGTLLKQKGDRKEALDQFRKAYELDPLNSRFRADYEEPSQRRDVAPKVAPGAHPPKQ